MDSNMTVETNLSSKPKKVLKRETKRKIFFAFVVAYPLLHFAFFYVYVHYEMFAMAFQTYQDVPGKGIVGTFAGFANFEKVINVFINPAATLGSRLKQNEITAISKMFGDTFSFFGMTMVFLPCGILFAYYVYKNYPLSGLFRVILYLPNILSGVVMTTMFKDVFNYIIGDNYLQIPHLIAYNFIMGFGLNVVMYTSAMCGIDTSIPESCQLDGASAIKEFWFVTVPMIFPTIITFLVMSLSGIFGQQAHLYTFFGETAAREGVTTIGYFMYINQIGSGLIIGKKTAAHVSMTYSELAAMGLMFTAIVVPLTLTTRRLLEKYGPSDR